MKKYLLIGYSVLFFTGCQTIYFKKNNLANIGPRTNERFHHIGAAGIVEFSEPYNPSKTCKNWESVYTENSFKSVLASMVTYGVYSPRIVGVVCSQN